MPELGTGALTGSYQPYRAQSALYLATYVATGVSVPPTAKLADTEPPTGTWTKLGLLQDDEFTVNNVEANFTEDRRGSTRRLFGRAVTQAGAMNFESLVVESDPDALANVIGGSTTAIGAVGEKIQVSFDQLYDYSALIWMKNHFDSAEERYIFVPHAQLMWTMDRGNENVLVLRVTLEALQYIQGSDNYAVEFARFD
jgi:hypothetical protein